MKPPKNLSTKLSPQQWYDSNVNNGNKLAADYPDVQQQIGMGKYFSFYNPNEYSRHPDGGFRNIANPDLKDGDSEYNPIIDYQAPAPVIKSSKPTVSVSPDHKPLDIGPNLTYNPNTGTYANSTTGKGIDVVNQFKKGGLVKGYDGGGDVVPQYNLAMQSLGTPIQTTTPGNYQNAFTNANAQNTYTNNGSNKKQNAPGITQQQKLTAIGLAGRGLNAIGGPQDTNMKYGTDDYFNNRNQSMQQGEGIANTVGAIPIVGAFKSLGEGAQNALAPKDAYGVSNSSDLAVGAGGFLNPLESTTSAYNDIKSGKFTGKTAANLLLPGVGAILNNNENKKQRDLLQQKNVDDQNTANLQQRYQDQKGAVQRSLVQRDSGDNTDVVNTNYLAPYTPIAGPTQSTGATGLTKDWRDAGNSISSGWRGLGKGLGFKNGGLTSAKAATILHEGIANGHKITDKQRRFFGWKSDQKKKDGGPIEGPGTGKSDSIPAKIKEDSFVVPEENAPMAEIIREKILKAPSKKANLNQKNGEPVKLSNGEHLFNPGEVSEIKATGINIDSLAPNAQRATTQGGKDLGYANGGKTKAPKVTPDYLNRVDNGYIPYQQSDPELKTSDPSYQDLMLTGEGAKRYPKNADSDSKFDWGQAIDYGIPLIQAGLGAAYLKKAGARPVDQLDPDYLNSISTAQGNVALAQANAKYGFTPEEQTQINNQNQNLTNAGNYAARNFSGGSSGNAFNLTRANLNDAANRNLNTAVQNRNLMFQKQGIANDRQQYLDSLIGNKVNMSNRLFNLKLDAWQQQQQTGAGLIASAAQNALGARQWNQELQASKDRSAMYNPQPVTTI